MDLRYLKVFSLLEPPATATAVTSAAEPKPMPPSWHYDRRTVRAAEPSTKAPARVRVTGPRAAERRGGMPDLPTILKSFHPPAERLLLHRNPILSHTSLTALQELFYKEELMDHSCARLELGLETLACDLLLASLEAQSLIRNSRAFSRAQVSKQACEATRSSLLCRT